MKSIFFFLFSFLIASSVAHADDLATLSSRIKAEYLATVSPANASTYASTQRSDGTWADVVYTVPTDWNGWKAMVHLDRVWAMTIAYQKSGTSTYHNSALRIAIIRGFDNWTQKNYQHPNWWQLRINAPRLLTKIMLLMESEFTASQIDLGIDRSNDADYMSSFYVGQNRVWLASIAVHRYLLASKRNLTEVKRALAGIEGTLAISDLEGIRQDFAFHQHGRQLYNSSYGQDYAKDIGFWMNMLKGLSINFTTTSIANFSSMLLDGAQWMIRRNQWDVATAGRNFSRPTALAVKPELIKTLDIMAGLGTSRKAEFQNFKTHMAGGKDDALIGNKNFWLTNYQVHRRYGYYVSVKACSVLVDCHEYGNGENSQGYYLTQGAMSIMRDGSEYSEIWPVLDYARIPGVTSPHKSVIPKPPTWGTKSSATYVGGVSTGMYGANGFSFNWDGVTGKKAWFFFRDEVVALGAGITSSSDAPINTTLNQAVKRGSIYVGNSDADPGAVVSGGERVINPKWIHHDNVGYIFPRSQTVHLKDVQQTGSWSRINSAGSTTSVSKWVFSLWMDHGLKPNGASYEYIILPGASLATMQNYNSTNVRIIENSTARQAVRNDALKVAGVIFYAPGTIAIRSGLTLQVDQKVAVLINEAVSPMQISVASPESKAMTAKVILSGSVNQTLSFNLLGGRLGGKSVTLTASASTTPTPTSTTTISGPTWKNAALTSRTGRFEAKFTMTPNGSTIDAVTGFSYGAATSFAKLATAVRFNPQGYMDARNGGVYAASASLRYTYGKSYAIRMRVDLATRKYTVYVTPSGGTEIQLANTFSFRAEQAAITQVNNIAHYAAVGSHTVTSPTITTLP